MSKTQRFVIMYQLCWWLLVSVLVMTPTNAHANSEDVGDEPFRCELPVPWLQRCVDENAYYESLHYLAFMQTMERHLPTKCPRPPVKWVWDNPRWCSVEDRVHMSQPDVWHFYETCWQQLTEDLQELLHPPPPTVTPFCKADSTSPLRERCTDDNPTRSVLDCGESIRACIPLSRMHRMQTSIDKTFSYLCACKQ